MVGLACELSFKQRGEMQAFGRQRVRRFDYMSNFCLLMQQNPFQDESPQAGKWIVQTLHKDPYQIMQTSRADPVWLAQTAAQGFSSNSLSIRFSCSH